MARKQFSCDFETTTKIDDCRVWAYGWMEIGKLSNYNIGNDINEFMDWVSMVQADLFFHNLRFDGEFIINWLLKNGFTWSSKANEPNTFSTLISKMGQWYMIEICYGYRGKNKLHTRIYDSLKKIPFPVKKIAKDFKLPILKGDIDYHLERPIGWEITPEEHAYIKNDIEIVARALEIQFEQGLNKITAGSDSLHQFKNIISTKGFNKLFPVLDEKLDKNIRRAYKGGFTWVNERFQGKDIGDGMVFDVNSLYPAMMYDKPLVFGMPIYFDGEYEYDSKYPLYIQHMRCSFELKEGYIPTIQLKKTGLFKDNEYLKSSKNEVMDLYVTNIDLELIKEHYILEDVEYKSGFKFRQKIGIFKAFIDKWMYVKTHSEGAKKQLAKLILNSCYGKFATSTDVTGKIPYLKKDGSCGFTLPKDDFGNIIRETKDPIYTPMGIFITSWARYTTITTAQKCFDRIIYCDTDSIHLTGTSVPDAIKDIVDPNKLGHWKHEGTFKRGKFIRQKTYVEDYYAKEIEKDGKMIKVMCSPEEATTTIFDVKCAGMPESIKEFVTFENFKIGFKADGKLMPKHVNGGVVLVDTTFEIK